MKFLVLLFCAFFLSVNDIHSQIQQTIINNSYIEFTIPEKDLLPESIAYDPLKENFYVGSTRKGKVIKISKEGVISDFIRPKQDGLWMVIGIKIDVKRRLLWLCSSGGDNLEGYDLEDDKQGRPAAIYKYNLDSGKLIKKYVLDASGEVHFFNDLAITRQGDVYVSHMFEDAGIYKISVDQDQLIKLYTSDIIKYPNGITFSDDESKLYVAHSEGIAIIDMSTGRISPIQIPTDLKISRRESIDGLYCYKNTLIGIQPDINTVQRFELDPSGTSITNSALLEVNHPMMNNPTAGELVENTLYYIANAQFGSFNKNGSLYSMEKLYEPTILKVKVND